MRILVVGDVHGAFMSLRALCVAQQPDLILQVGDFGIWPSRLPELRELHQAATGEIRFIDGNHEHFPTLGRFVEGQEIAPRVFYQPRGSSITLPDGRVVCFLGGAKSVDRPLRTPDQDWFPEEILDRSVLDVLPERADIVISHTAPRCLGIAERLNRRHLQYGAPAGWDLSPDPSEEVLDQVLERLRPSLWHFGHYHERFEFVRQGCVFFGLTALGQDGASRWLPAPGEMPEVHEVPESIFPDRPPAAPWNSEQNIGAALHKILRRARKHGQGGDGAWYLAGLTERNARLLTQYIGEMVEPTPEDLQALEILRERLGRKEE